MYAEGICSEDERQGGGVEPRRLAPGERIPELDGVTVGDFWAWAYSDILENTAREIFAEYLVGNALGVVKGVRPSGWGTFDLRYGDRNIEVKSSSYLQSWHQTALSVIRFDVAEHDRLGPGNQYLEGGAHAFSGLLCVLPLCRKGPEPRQRA